MQNNKDITRTSSGQFAKKHYTEPTERVCSKCGVLLPISSFRTSSRTRKDGLRWFSGTCRKCDRKYSSEFHKKYGTPEKERIQTLRRHNLTLEQWENMFESQDRKCAICGRFEPTGRGWATDHDHACCPGLNSCGQCVRGILCTRCNSVLGYAKDNPDVLIKAAEYLQCHAAS